MTIHIKNICKKELRRNEKRTNNKAMYNIPVLLFCKCIASSTDRKFLVLSLLLSADMFIRPLYMSRSQKQNTLDIILYSMKQGLLHIAKN